jgi:thiol-disulfide isomerase/thioredoxin
MRRLFLSLLALGAVAALRAQTPPTADAVMAEAQATAKAGHKAVFVHFGASWCIWCKRLDAFLAEKNIRPIIERHFVVVKLITQEAADKKALENAGSAAWLERLGGKGSGLPFSAMVAADGKTIVDSKRPANGKASNIGFPANPDEVAWFMEMLRKAAPSMPRADLDVIETRLKQPI